jgi:zinc transport system permease protein
MSVGILLVKITPGYNTELMSYLFGNLAVVGWDMVVLMAVLNLVILAVVLLFHKRLLAICIDEQQARLQGVSVMWTNILLLALVALTVICLIHVVGLILVLALLTLPAATASHHLRRLAPIMWGSAVLCALLTTLPQMLTYGVTVPVRAGGLTYRYELPVESVIVLSAGAVYLVSVLVTRVRRSLSR